MFALQDEVTRKIIAELAVRLTPREQAGQGRKETASVQAHDAFLRGWAHYMKAIPADYAKAVPFLKQAVRHDPAYGRAWAALAAVYRTARFRGWQGSLGMTPDDALEKAMEYLEKAARYPTPLAHQVASRIMTGQGAHDEAIEEAKRAIALNANDPAGHFAMARALTYAGRAADAIGFIEKAMRLDPHFPPDYLVHLGITRTADGAFTATGLWKDTGTSRVDGARLCNRWTKFSESCAVIYRNRDGGRETGNQYFLVQRSGVFPFVVAD